MSSVCRVCIGLVLKGRRGDLLMEKPRYSAFYADVYVAMAFHFVNCHHVCFIVTNGNRVASFSRALFSA